MKVLLVNPYITDFTAYDLWLKPLGLLYLASVLKEYTDCELYWLDVLDRFQEGAFLPGDPSLKNSHTDGRGKYHREIFNEKPDVYKTVPRHYCRYGIPFDIFEKKLDKIPHVDMIFITSLMTYWVDGLRITIDRLRDRFPGAKVILGGVLPSLAPEHLSRHGIRADHMIEGYGETKILELVEAQGAKVYSHPEFKGIDDLPYPAVEFLGSQKYLPLLTSRGCPFHCTYCASGILNKQWQERSPEKVWEEIHYMHDRFGTGHFAIFDDALLINKRKRFYKIFHQVKENLRVQFHTPNGLHVGEMDRETAELFFACGFKTLRLSFESTGAEILAKSSNKVTVKQMTQAVENLEAAGYKRKDIGVYLLFGYPGQKIIDIEESFRFVGDLGVTIHLSYYSPVPGTEDFAALQKSGALSTPMDLYETNKIYFVYNKSGFTREEIAGIKEKAAGVYKPQDANPKLQITNYKQISKRQ